MSNTIDTLRMELFATLKALRDPTNPMPIDRAKAVCDVGQTIINSAKVEVDMINAVGAGKMKPTGFIGGPTTPALEHAPAATAGNGLPPRGPTGRV